MKQTVESYEQHGYSLKVTNISMDCYYTSIPLMEWLCEKNIPFRKVCQKNSKKPKVEKKTAGFSVKTKMVRSILIIERQSPVVWEAFYCCKLQI